MKVWLVGERGMLGSSMQSVLRRLEVDFTGTDAELDITDAAAVSEFAKQGNFTHILNCAAFTNVDGAETEETLATAVNGVGVGNLWRATQELGATLLHISTDYVFDGSAERPYIESDATAPLGAYGRSKLADETAIVESPSESARAFIVRTSWLFGPFGKSFVTTMLRLFWKQPELRVVADQRGRPSYCPDLAEAAVRLIGLDGRACEPGIYHFAQTGECSWHEFACEILALTKAQGLPTVTQTIHPITTAEYPTPAKRPAYSVLDTSKIEAALGEKPREWKPALAEFVASTASQMRQATQ